MPSGSWLRDALDDTNPYINGPLKHGRKNISKNRPIEMYQESTISTVRNTKIATVVLPEHNKGTKNSKMST